MLTLSPAPPRFRGHEFGLDKYSYPPHYISQHIYHNRTQRLCPTPTPPPPKPPYALPRHTLTTMVLALPRPAADAPGSAWQDAVQDSLDEVTALNPCDAIEAMLAIDL